MVSKTSGLLYERRLIEKALAVRPLPPPRRRAAAAASWTRLLSARRATHAAAACLEADRRRRLHQESGECPVTKQPLSRDDLLAVRTNKVRVARARLRGRRGAGGRQP